MQVGSHLHANGASAELKLERGVEVLREVVAQLGGNHRLVHVEKHRLVFGPGAQFKRPVHELVLVIVRVAVLLLELAAVLEQANEL